MAVINQLNINLGTEANQNFVLHDINDKRITTTAITTCSHILASNSASLTSIAPITAANLASVLGAVSLAETDDFNTMTHWGTYSIYSSESKSHHPTQFSGSGYLYVYGWKYSGQTRTIQVLVTPNGIARRVLITEWSNWVMIYDESILTNSTLLSPLASALGVPSKVDYNAGSSFMSATIAYIEASFQQAQIYSKFENTFTSNGEGFYIGYKHSANAGNAILLNGSRFYIVQRNSDLNDGSWSYKIIA